MNEIIQEIMNMFEGGTLPAVSSLLLGAASLALSVAKNKLVKKLSDRTAEVDSLRNEVIILQGKTTMLEEKLEEANKINENTNQMVSAAVDMLHVAYLNSKLDINSKINLQKLYDKCPDASCDEATALIDTLNEKATEEQVQIVEEATPVSYADIIASKIEQEV